ncbi:MAG: hypothetical protein AVDCRST_MAG73-3513, partial [uncultured Thermomicrobiales bacterium]
GKFPQTADHRVDRRGAGVGRGGRVLRVADPRRGLRPQRGRDRPGRGGVHDRHLRRPRVDLGAVGRATAAARAGRAAPDRPAQRRDRALLAAFVRGRIGARLRTDRRLGSGVDRSPGRNRVAGSGGAADLLQGSVRRRRSLLRRARRRHPVV